MPLRFDPSNSHAREPKGGSNVQDGQYLSYDDGGGGNSIIDSNWGGRRDFKINHGWYFQNMRGEDRRVEPILGSTPQYDWHNKIAQVYNARVTGNLFLPLPGEYVLNPGDVPRGGQVPRPTDEVGGDAMEAPCDYTEAPLSYGGGPQPISRGITSGNPIVGRTLTDCSSGVCKRMR